MSIDHKPRLPLLAATLLAGALLPAACGSAGSKAATAGGPPSAHARSTVSLVAYSTPRAAYEQLEKAFAATPGGHGVRFEQSYGPSGDQARAVVAGLRADYVAFSVQTDMDRLVKAGEVAPDWNSGPEKGFVTDSVVVLVVRKGNPKHIHSWADLLRHDVDVVTPNPFSSGSARWNVMAAYGQVLKGGGTQAQGVEFLRKLFGRIVTQPASGREATSAFTSGVGDVLLSYENEAIFARRKGQPVDYVVPDATLLVQNPAAVTRGSAPAAAGLLAYVRSRPGQEIFAANGYRPVVAGVSAEVVGANDPTNPFPAPRHLFTIDDLGGWEAVTTRFFDPASGIVTAIERRKGIPVARS